MSHVNPASLSYDLFALFASVCICKEHPNVGVYVKGLKLMPCETQQDVMRSLASTCLVLDYFEL